MSCTYALCDHWVRDGDGSCWRGLKNSYKNTCSHNSNHGTPVLGGHGCRISSYRMSGCGSKEVLGYYGTNHTGDFTAFRGRNGDLRDNALRSMKIRDIPGHNSGRIKADTDSECPGIADTHVYHRTEGKKRSCFYDKSRPNEIRTVYDSKSGNHQMSSLFTFLKTRFCGEADNVFKNPGGGMCLEYDEGKRLAKLYCQVGDRIATDANCTEDNLGNHYEELAEAYCKTHDGKHNQWCSCYNVSNDVCKNVPNAAGCDKKKQVFDPLVEATPEKFRHVWSGKAKCFGSVCVGKKYVPTNANQGCDAPVQICAQSFDLDNVSGSTIEAKCEQTAIQNNSSSQPSTQPSAGDSPSGPVPTQAQGAITNSQIPAINIDLSTLTEQQKVTVGLAALCLCLMFFLIIF